MGIREAPFCEEPPSSRSVRGGVEILSGLRVPARSPRAVARWSGVVIVTAIFLSSAGCSERTFEPGDTRTGLTALLSGRAWDSLEHSLEWSETGEATVREILTSYLESVCQFLCAERRTLERVHQQSVYEAAYLGRVLVGAYEVTLDSRFLECALALAADLLEQQRSDGYWIAAEHGSIYLADLGSLMGFFMSLAGHTTGSGNSCYLDAVEGFAQTVLSDGMILESGALDVGYLCESGAGCARLEGPFTISTALVGVEVFSWLYSQTGLPLYRDVATDALEWILALQSEDGSFPYILPARGADPALGTRDALHHIWSRRRYTTSTYVGESLMIAYDGLAGEAVERIRAAFRTHVEMLLDTQRQDGLWGLNWHDRRRCGGCVSLLAWYYREVDQDPRIVRAIDRFLIGAVQNPPKQLNAWPDIEVDEAREYPDTGAAFVARAVVHLLRPGDGIP